MRIFKNIGLDKVFILERKQRYKEMMYLIQVFIFFLSMLFKSLLREGFIKKKKKIREFSLSSEGPLPPSIIREKIFFCFFIYGV